MKASYLGACISLYPQSNLYVLNLVFCIDMNKYFRREGEPEDEFVERILAIVKKNRHLNDLYLVGNTY